MKKEREITIAELIRKLQEEARRKGLDKLTDKQIQAEIEAYRREKASNAPARC